MGGCSETVIQLERLGLFGRSLIRRHPSLDRNRHIVLSRYAWRLIVLRVSDALDMLVHIQIQQ